MNRHLRMIMSLTFGLLAAVSFSACGFLDVMLADVHDPDQTTDGADDTTPADDGQDSAPLYVNIQIDAEREDVDGLTRVTDEFDRRGIRTTVYVTGDYANQHALLVQDLYLDGHEIALHGYYTGEQLATMTYEEQADLLTRAKTALEGCQPCGTYKPIDGFRPQYFSQNEDTYRVLDEIDIRYNSGFKAGQIFVEGHAEDAAPYPVDGHTFHAVPITTVEYHDHTIYLCDIACANVEEMTGLQWSEALSIGLDQALEREQPLVVLLHGWHTGDADQYDYWQPFVDLLDDVAAHEGIFVTTHELVDLYAE